MIVRETPTQLTLKDTPGCLRFLGCFFLAGGALALYGGLGGFSNSDELSPLERLAVVFVGCCHLLGGSWVLWGARTVRVVFDRVAGQVTVARSGIGRRSALAYALAELHAIVVEQSEDSDGDPCYMLELVFPQAREPILAMHSHNKEACELLRKRLAAFLGRDEG
jgi:hypothetical protein